jgi:hypothetical protein
LIPFFVVWTVEFIWVGSISDRQIENLLGFKRLKQTADNVRVPSFGYREDEIFDMFVRVPTWF